MRITDALLGEHGVFYAMFDYVEQTTSRSENSEELKILADLLATTLLSHARLEDNLLLPAMEPEMGPRGPLLAAIRREHRDIEGTVTELMDLQGLAELKSRMLHLVRLARLHFKNEEQSFFAVALEVLGETRLNEFGSQWASARGVTIPAVSDIGR